MRYINRVGNTGRGIHDQDVIPGPMPFFVSGIIPGGVYTSDHNVGIRIRVFVDRFILRMGEIRKYATNCHKAR